MSYRYKADVMPETPHHFHRHGDFGLRSEEGSIFKVYAAPLTEDQSSYSRKSLSYSRSPYLLPDHDTLSINDDLHEILGTKSQLRQCTLSTGFCIKYKINRKIKNPIKDKLVEKAGKQGAQCALLTWAGERKDVGIARLASGQMDIQNFFHPKLPNKLDPAQWDNFLFWDVMTKLPSMWRLTILQLTIQSPGNELPHEYDYKGKSNGGSEGLKIWMDWKRVADASDLKAV